MIARKADDCLSKWLRKKRRKPLILRGARQVGKSTLVQEFARKNDLVLHEINLERHLHLDKAFQSLDTKKILMELEIVTGQPIHGDGHLLFLDEIQATPHALAALRYFYEDLPGLPVISAGSLLEFTLAKHSFSMPVGRVEYHYICPLRFSEFLGYLEPSLEKWREAACNFEKIPVTAHQNLLSKLREYLFVGGMPEAVMEYGESGSLASVQEIHRSIVETYQDDFAKYANHSELVRLQRIFSQVPRNIGKKVKYVNFSREERSRETKAAIELLCRAQVCTKVHASDCSGIPIHSGIKEGIYKLLSMDVGIVNYLCGLRWDEISNAQEVTLINEGPLAEQFIGQHLATLGPGKPELHYWLREGRANNAEVDYVLQQGAQLLPVEVKAGASGSLKSLQQFALEKGSAQAIRFDLNPPSKLEVVAKARSKDSVETVGFELRSLPLYAVEGLGVQS